jgi:hypothetical protein
MGDLEGDGVSMGNWSQTTMYLVSRRVCGSSYVRQLSVAAECAPPLPDMTNAV